jgi:tricorn protease
MPRPLLRWSLLLLVFCLGAAAAPAADPYARHPDIHGDTVVFVAESDLWSSSLANGETRRLTSHVGEEIAPAFAPDGRTIAFTGQYDGNPDVYLVDAEGGEPRRLTWHPGADEVVGWTPDGERVIFRSSRNDPHGTTHLFTIDLDSGETEELPLGWAARIAIDPDSGRWAFVRTTRENATWKRYRGGTASDIWVGDPSSARYRPITDFPGADNFPMWHGGRIWFLSDQGGTANIWSMAADGSDRRRHTQLGEWDARWPAMGPDGRIVFGAAADLHLFDPRDGSVRRLEIDLPSDRVLTRVRYPDVGRGVEGLDLSPDGERAVVVTRGEVFSVPVEKGPTLPLTRGTGARERAASYGPDGERILLVNDEGGEEKLQVMDAWGRGERTRLAGSGEEAWHRSPRWSPDGKWVAYAEDSDYSLRLVSVEGDETLLVDQGEHAPIGPYAFSPDGRWLAYVKAEPTRYGSIFLYDTRAREAHRVTGAYTDDGWPAWDPEGRYLYFVSSRATNPVLGSVDRQNVEVKNDRLYVVLLRSDVENPLARTAGLPPAEDAGQQDGKGDEKKEKQTKNGDDAGEGAEDDAPAPVEIELDGLAERTVELPVDRGRYAGLGATAGKLFYIALPLQGMAEQGGFFEESAPQNTLMAFDLDGEKAEPFVEGVSSYALAPKADKMAVQKRPGEIYVVSAAAPPGPKLAESRLDLSDVSIELDPAEEWRQILREAWRGMREFYWDPNMGDLDWDAIYEQYATLLPRVASRADLSDLIGQMIGELATSHTYVFGGDPGVQVPQVATGLLGADLVREAAAWRVERIYRGDAADLVRSPLSEPGVDVEEGDFVLEVNRRPVPADRPFHAALADLAGKKVLLTVNDRPTREGAREVVVVPLRSERPLRYADWVRRNREQVAEKTGGRIGYIHIPDMGRDGMIAFNRWFYPQLDREGMVVDVRWNGGGFASQMMLERLRRPLVSFDKSRGGAVFTYPQRVLNGPFVVLTNEFAGSDGDIFPQAVQLEDLAPVIGMRSWGGVVGINSIRRLVDGGLVTNPQVAWWDARDGWSLENRGVIPDIEVQNPPAAVAEGRDPQLDRAIEEVLRLHAENPPARPDFEPAPERTREAFRDELSSSSE